MRSMRSVRTMVLLGMWLGGFSACTSVLMNTQCPRVQTWVVTLGQVTKGPDEYVGEQGRHETLDGRCAHLDSCDRTKRQHSGRDVFVRRVRSGGERRGSPTSDR